MSKKPIIPRLFLITAVLAIQCVNGRTQTNTAAAIGAPSQVIIVGTFHSSHSTNVNYSVNKLRNIIVALKPGAILVELPPEIRGHPTIENSRVIKQLDRDECAAANLAADILGVKVIPYDREGRNEFYQRTRYFPREHAASVALEEWIEAQARENPDSIQVLAGRLKSEAVASLNRLIADGRPEIINSPAYDMAAATKHGMVYGILPKLLAASGRRELAEERLFLADEWEERNGIMARNILEIAQRFAGKRLVVLAGAEHRYRLRELLVKAPQVELKEFYQVPGWAEEARPAQ